MQRWHAASKSDLPSVVSLSVVVNEMRKHDIEQC